MANERLRTAMAKAGVSIEAVARAADVDPKIAQRWISGRVPYARHRFAVAALIHEHEDYLWPDAPGRDQANATGSTAEIKAAYAYRADLPPEVWRSLLSGACRHIDLLGYAMLFFPEQHANMIELLRAKGEAGCRIRVCVADPESPQTDQRDELEHLGGTLPDRIRTTLKHFRPLQGAMGFELRLHEVHLYSAVYRFDDDLVVTPYLVGAHGYQHPVLQLRRLGPVGLYEQYASQFERVWTTAAPSLETGAAA